MAAEAEPDETAAAQSIMNVTPEPISTPAPEYDELQAYTADNDTTYVAMQEGKVYLSDMPWKSATNVYGDGELLAQTDYMTGSDDGQALSVDVGNVQVLKLSATKNGSNNHNHADWADAKLTPKTQTVDMGYFGYCGEYYDPELDMIYLRNRYYSPGIWNAAYRSAIAEGSKTPVRYADDVTRRMVAGRGIGELPYYQKSKLVGMLIPFTLESGNVWDAVGDMMRDSAHKHGVDTKQGLARKAAKVGAGVDFGADLLVLFVMNYLFNYILAKIRGTDGGLFDPIADIKEGVRNNKGVLKTAGTYACAGWSITRRRRSSVKRSTPN